MNLKELLAGTPEEKDAQSAVRRLKGRRKLAPSQRDQLNRASVISRRLLLRRAVISGTFLVASGIGVNMLAPRRNQDPEVTKLYPEIDLDLKSKGSFSTTFLNRSVTWFNFTDATFGQKAAQELFDFIETVGLQQLSGEIKGKKGNILKFGMTLHNPSPAKIFLVPETAKLPSWLKKSSVLPGEILSEDALTVLGTAEGLNLTLIRLTDPRKSKSNTARLAKTREDWADNGFAVEAGVITLIPVDEKNRVEAQELFCNSLGFAISAKRHMDYETYSKFTEDTEIQFYLDTFPMIKFSESFYDQIPVVHPVIRK